MRSLRVLGLVALLGAGVGCGGGGGGGGAEPGLLNLTLNTPNTDDGAVLFRVTGGDVDSVLNGAMTQSSAFSVTPSFTRVVAAGDLTDGVVAQIAVPDINDVSSYAVIVDQVAVRNSFAQRSLTGYSIAVSVAP